MNWSSWRQQYEAKQHRPFPTTIAPPPLSKPARDALLHSLQIFQIGETGEGRIVREIDRAHFGSIDAEYRKCLKLLIAEEGRHSRLLTTCLRGLGGAPAKRTWAERLFVFGRRAAGLRLKLLVLFIAEVIGIAFYDSLSEHLPPSELQQTLAQICDDERLHFRFHQAFFADYANTSFRRLLFRAAWWSLGLLCLAAVVLDHRRTFRALGLPTRVVLLRAWSLLAEMDHSLAGIRTPSPELSVRPTTT